MIIGVDIDGVLADFGQALAKRLVEVTGEDKLPPWPFEIKTWWWPIDQFGYTKEQTMATLEDVWQDPSFWQELPRFAWTERAMQSLGELWQDCHDIYFVTDRKGVNVKVQTEMWLDAFAAAAPTVLISDQKGLCAKALKFDLYVDDKIENCEAVRNQSPSTLCFMLAQSWNHEIPGVARIATLDDFFTAIEGALDASRS